jgi:hypothetical protein
MRFTRMTGANFLSLLANHITVVNHHEPMTIAAKRDVAGRSEFNASESDRTMHSV